MGDPTDEIHVLIFDHEEYIYWVSLFEDKADAKTHAKVATDALRDPDGGSHSFRVQTYKFYRRGSEGPTLDQLKADVDEYTYDEDGIWKQTAEERVEDLDYLGFEERVEELGSELGILLFLPTESALAALPRDRQIAIVEWVYESDHTTKPPLELDGSVSPGQQELPS